MNRIKSFFKAGSPALKYKWCYFVLAVIGIASIGLELAYAEVNRTLFSNIGLITVPMAIGIVSTFGLIILAQYIIGFLDNCISTYFNESVVYAMRRELLKRIEHLPLEYFDNNHSGKIINLFFSQLETVKDFVVSDVQALIRLPLSFVIISGYLFTVHPLLGFIAVFSSVLQPLSSFVFRKTYESSCDDVRMTTNNIFSVMQEVIQGVREVKINQIEDYFDRKMRELQKCGVRQNLRIVILSTVRWIIKEIPTKIGYLAGIGASVYLIIQGNIGAGDLMVFITLLSKVSEPFNGITSVISNLQGSLSSADDLIKLINESSENYDSGECGILPIENIEFKNVDFSYTVRDEENEDESLTKKIPVLHDLSFDIPVGKTIALVGPSGSGKSTVIRLLYGFYRTDSGKITINGRNIEEYNIKVLRSVMSVVSQDIFMFDGTVRENLVLGREDISEEKLMEALRYSESYDFVMNLPDGLETNLGERGIKVSQGQKQRLSIARAILRQSLLGEAGVLILDEPTSSLDVETEYNFQQGIEKWAKNCTKIVIAHRLTTIRNADYIVFLEDGYAVEQGTPSELLSKEDSKFREYWQKQFVFNEDDK